MGLQTFHTISVEFEQYTGILGLFILGFASILYLLDCSNWSSPRGRALKDFSLILLATVSATFILFTSSSRPYSPISLLLILTPLWLSQVGSILYPEVKPRIFVSWLSGPLYVVSCAIFFSWLIWAFWSEDNEWNVDRALSRAEESGCRADFDMYPDCKDEEGTNDVCFTFDEETSTIQFGENCDVTCTHVYDTCLNTFMIWVGPFLVSTGFLFLSFFSSFIREGPKESGPLKFVKVWMFLLFAMWVAASLAGAGAGVSTALTAFVLSALIASVVLVIISYSAAERKERLQSFQTLCVEKYGNLMDLFRGLVVITCTPIAVVWIALSFVIQSTRNLATNCLRLERPPKDTSSVEHVDGAGILTIEARRLIREVRTWNMTRVSSYALKWGTAFMTLSVIVSKFTVILLSWVIEETSDTGFVPVTYICVAVGLFMFLLPPVPGAPIYMVMGILIIPAGEEDLGAIGSVIYAMGISLSLKILACTLQQKVIGGLLKNRVAVRQFVGVNSTIIRSMKLLLQDEGISLAKVCILVGGPDWPTSVLCGIMDLPLLPILIGTLPIIFLIIPTLLTGSFTYLSSVRTEDGQAEYPWTGTATAVFIAITGIVQFGSMVVAAFFLERTATLRKEEVEAIPIDEEVKEADERDEAFNKAYEEVTTWDKVPILAKLTLLLSLTSMMMCSYMVQLFSTDCFAEYELTYTIDTHLDGSWLHIVKPLGSLAMIFFLVSLILYYCFYVWASVSQLPFSILIFLSYLSLPNDTNFCNTKLLFFR